MKDQKKELTVTKTETTKIGFISLMVISAIIIFGIIFAFKMMYKKPGIRTITPTIKSADMKISSDGMVRSENEATLRFLTSGKLTYLPFKEGDKVYKGQTIASLDTYQLQKQLTATLNNYRVTRNNFDQAQDNNQDNYLKGQMLYPAVPTYNNFNLAGIGGDVKDNAVNNMIKRLLDQNQANLDNSVIQVELANYAISLSSLQAPFNGIISKLDVTTPYVMVSPTTSFTIIDPEVYVFRANVSESDINYIDVGSKVTIRLTGDKDSQYEGMVTRIYPDKVTLSTGENVYQADVTSDKLPSVAKYRQDGNVMISNKYQREIVLIPSWLVLGKQFVWVEENGKIILKPITVGDAVGDNIEVHGLSGEDKLIINPESVAAPHYSIL